MAVNDDLVRFFTAHGLFRLRLYNRRLSGTEIQRIVGPFRSVDLLRNDALFYRIMAATERDRRKRNRYRRRAGRLETEANRCVLEAALAPVGALIEGRQLSRAHPGANLRPGALLP